MTNPTEKWLYGPSTYWFWPRIPTQAEIEQQVAEMAQAGYRTFLIQARLGMPLEEYLSPAYLQAYRSAVEAGAKLGLYAGIYDDYNWMSGHAGGRSVQLNPLVRERCLFWTQSTISAGQAEAAVSGIHSLMYEEFSPMAMAWAYQDAKPEWADWRTLCALAVPHGDQTIEWCQVRNVTAQVRLEGGDQGCRVRLEQAAPELEGYDLIVFVHADCVSSRMVNYLHAETAETFIQAGLEPYAQAVGDYFGSTIPYLFFDHPYGGFYTWTERRGALGNSLMFTPDLVQCFMEDRGYPLEEALLSFLIDLGDQSPRLRCDFFETYGRLGRQRFFGPLAAWARAHGLQQSGHELLGYVGAWGVADGFSSIDVRTNFGADYFAIDRYKDLSAIDSCNYVPQAGPHFGASIARANGKQGCLVEQYVVSTQKGLPGAVGNWGLTPAALQRQGLRFLIQGASHWINHAFYLEDGRPGDIAPLSPRFDFPPGINYEPWFAYHPQFAQTWNRLAEFIAAHPAEGDVPRVAVLYPLRTYWDEGSQGLFSQHCAAWFQYLDRMGIAFDLIDERQLEEAVFDRGCLHSGAFRYGWLILPAVHVLHNRHSLEQIERFLAVGGTVIQSGAGVRATQSGGALNPAQQVAWDVLATLPRWLVVSDLTRQLTDATLARWAGMGSQGPILLPDPDAPGQVWFKRYAAKAGWDALVFNDSDHPQRVEIAYPAGMEPFLLDIDSAEPAPYAFGCSSPYGPTVLVDLQPGEWRLLQFANQMQCGLRLKKTSLLVLEARSNACSLDVRLLGNGRIDFDIDLCCAAEAQLQSAAVEAWSSAPITHGRQRLQMKLASWAHSRDVTGPWSIQAGGKIFNGFNQLSVSWEELELNAYKGVGVCRSEVTLSAEECQVSWALLTPEYHGVLAVTVNGQTAGAAVIDHGLVVIDRSLLHAGQNTLELTTVNSADGYYYHDTPYAALAGRNSGRIGRVCLYPCIDCHIIFDSLSPSQEECHD